MDPNPTQVVEVKIYNQTYYIRGEGDTEYIEQLAAYVDLKMREVAAGTMTADSLRVAILAALNIADELSKMRRKIDQIDNTINERSTEFSQLLDNLLKKAK
jgi:cell division protein ZapA